MLRLGSVGMSEPGGTDEAIRKHVAFAGRLTPWMERAGVLDGETQADLGVGFADIIFAASEAEKALKELVALDPQTVEGAREALSHLGYLHALFLTEIKDHLSDLERTWPVLEQHLVLTADFGDDDDDDPQSQ
jgi:hypothetical protein